MRPWVICFLSFLVTSIAVAAPAPAPSPASSPSNATSSSCYAPDQVALLSFSGSFTSTAGSAKTFFSQYWSTPDCCSWQGVTCNPSNSRVSSLSLLNGNDNLQLLGPIPNSVCNLSALTSLFFYDVALRGAIPDCIGTQLTNLQQLTLASNMLTGVIPSSFSNLNQSLQMLALYDNQLSGRMPASVFAHFSQLAHLQLQTNSFSGSIPPLFSPALWYVDLSHNILSGSITATFAYLNQSLQVLLLSNNQLTGPLPASFINHLNHTAQLDLSSNSFSGAIPPLSSPFLQSLDLHQNLLSGSLSLFSSLSNLSSLSSLFLDSNNLSGPIPPSLQPSSFPSLTQLSMSNNFFNGSFPACLCFLTNLSALNLASNLLSDSLDRSELQNCAMTSVNLQNLHLSGNQFTGQFPPWIASLPALQSAQGAGPGLNVDVSDNLMNSLPNNLPNASQNMRYFVMHHNQITGPFPEWIGSFPLLWYLDLSYNFFNGSLPQSWANLSALVTIDISHGNMLHKDPNNPAAPLLPRWLFQFPLISGIGLSSVQLEPADMGNCASRELYPEKLLVNTSLSDLDLSYNHLTASSLSCFFDSAVMGNSSNAPLMLHSLNLSGNPLDVDLNDPHMMSIFLSASIVDIQSLDLSSCELQGRLSEAFLDQLRLHGTTEFYAAHNHLVGEIPAQLGNLSDLLSFLDLSHNHFTSIAAFDGNRTLNWLQSFELSNNSLAGSLPSILSKLGNGSSNVQLVSLLFNLDLSYNLLNGSIPGNLLSWFPKLQRLKLNANFFEGTIPMELLQNSTLPSLRTLSLSNNQLTGAIAAPFKNHNGLVFLDLSHNMLEGDMQMVVFGVTALLMPSLRVLLLSHNNFNGSVPAGLGKLTPALQVIDMSSNHLIGPIPVHTLRELKAFQATSASSPHGKGTPNILYEDFIIQVKGSQRSYIYVLQVLVSLDLSGNDLSGSIPLGLSAMSGLIFLNFSNNDLSGQIPSDLGELTLLEALDLSYNKLAGSIPASFSNLTQLEVFNLSYNKELSGPIPPNNPQIQNEESYLGDVGLCGEPILGRPCHRVPSSDTPSIQDIPPNEGNPSLLASFIDVWVSIPGFFLGLFVGFVGVVLLIMRLTMGTSFYRKLSSMFK